MSAAAESAALCAPARLGAVQALLASPERLHGAMRGWIDQLLFDRAFIDPKLKPRAARVGAAGQAPGALIEVAAAEALARALEVADYAALDALCGQPLSALCADDGEHGDFDPGAAARVLIVGAGPVGCALAAALRRASGGAISVLLLESRALAPGRKPPYRRDWLTHLPIALFAGLLGEDVLALLARIGSGGYCGASLRVIESLALLDARRLGVRCRFAAQLPIEALAARADLVFDASGGQWGAAAPGPLRPCQRVHSGPLVYPGAGYRAFGLRTPEQHPNLVIDIATDGRWLYPLQRGAALRSALLKVVDIAPDCQGDLLAQLARANPHNRCYLWPGHLAPPHNRLLLLIGLERGRHDALSRAMSAEEPLREWLARPAVRAQLDRDLLALLRTVVAADGGPVRARVERPFIVAPRLRDPAALSLHCGGTPVLPVGDALHSGNPKSGNGLGQHLALLGPIVAALTGGSA